MTKVFPISEAASLAIHTMVLLAGDPGKLSSTNGIAAELGVSEAHLAKVLQRLAKEGLVKSVRGPAGGFQLSGDPEGIALMEIYEAIDGPFDEHECLLSSGECRRDSCVFGDMARSIGGQIREYLSKTTLAQLTDKGDRT